MKLGNKEILPATPKIKKVKEKKDPTEYWQEIVDTWFTFYKKKFGENPVFDSSAPRDLKLIAVAMKKMAFEKSIEWTKDTATRSLIAFLQMAEFHTFLKDNFMLFLLNRHKEKVFQMLSNKKNGKSANEPFTREGVNSEFGNRNYEQYN